MPQLETLWIDFHSAVLDSDLESQLLHNPIASHADAVLPNLRLFAFARTSAYLEALLPWMTTPILERLQLGFSNKLIFSLPNLLHFMIRAKNIEYGSAKISFSIWGVFMRVYPHEGAKVYTFHIFVARIRTS
jgi:hypothetical protein